MPTTIGRSPASASRPASSTTTTTASTSCRPRSMPATCCPRRCATSSCGTPTSRRRRWRTPRSARSPASRCRCRSASACRTRWNRCASWTSPCRSNSAARRLSTATQTSPLKASPTPCRSPAGASCCSRSRRIGARLLTRRSRCVRGCWPPRMAASRPAASQARFRAVRSNTTSTCALRCRRSAARICCSRGSRASSVCRIGARKSASQPT